MAEFYKIETARTACSSVYVMVQCLSGLSVPSVDCCSSMWRVCCCGPSGQELSFDCCTAGAQLTQEACLICDSFNTGLHHTHPFNGPFSGTTQVCWYQKGKTNLDFTEARGSGMSWAICKSAPCSRQTTTRAPHHSVFTGRMLFLPPNQQSQST